jgi:hypothetical protein
MNSINSNKVAIGKVSKKQLAANQNNAEKSTGPKTKAGKLAVAANGIAHGIYTISPVVAGVESVRDWHDYHTEMMASLAPVGMLEITLAERITLSGWRLRRVARYESERIRSEQDAGKDEVGSRLRLNLYREGDPADEIEKVVRRIKWYERCWRCAKLLAEGKDDVQVDMGDAKELLVYLEYKEEERYAEAHEYDRVQDDFEKSERLEDPERWTIGSLRQRVQHLAENLGMSDDSVHSLQIEISQDYSTASMSVKLAKRRLKESRRERLLPDEKALEKVMRYESHLSRLLHRDLHELQRLQAPRKGQPVAAPVAIDIDVASGPEARSENGV